MRIFSKIFMVLACLITSCCNAMVPNLSAAQLSDLFFALPQYCQKRVCYHYARACGGRDVPGTDLLYFAYPGVTLSLEQQRKNYPWVGEHASPKYRYVITGQEYSIFGWGMGNDMDPFHHVVGPNVCGLAAVSRAAVNIPRLVAQADRPLKDKALTLVGLSDEEPARTSIAVGLPECVHPTLPLLASIQTPSPTSFNIIVEDKFKNNTLYTFECEKAENEKEHKLFFGPEDKLYLLRPERDCIEAYDVAINTTVNTASTLFALSEAEKNPIPLTNLVIEECAAPGTIRVQLQAFAREYTAEHPDFVAIQPQLVDAQYSPFLGDWILLKFKCCVGSNWQRIAVAAKTCVMDALGSTFGVTSSADDDSSDVSDVADSVTGPVASVASGNNAVGQAPKKDLEPIFYALYNPAKNKFVTLDGLRQTKDEDPYEFEGTCRLTARQRWINQYSWSLGLGGIKRHEAYFLDDATSAHNLLAVVKPADCVRNIKQSLLYALAHEWLATPRTERSPEMGEKITKMFNNHDIVSNTLKFLWQTGDSDLFKQIICPHKIL